MQPISLETLADLAKHHYGLAAHCWRCERWHDFDIDGLVARIGNRSIVRFKPRCSVCGERAEKQVTPPLPKFEGYPKQTNSEFAIIPVKTNLRSERYKTAYHGKHVRSRKSTYPKYDRTASRFGPIQTTPDKRMRLLRQIDMPVFDGEY